MNDSFWELLTKFYTGQLTPVEKTEFEQLLLKQPNDWLKTGELAQIDWNTKILYGEEKSKKLADKIIGMENTESDSSPIQSPNKRNRIRLFVAVCSIIIFGVVSIFLWRLNSSDEWQNITTAAGVKTTLILPDGTEICLNSGSTFRYPKKFDKHLREVYLTGEGFFKVAHNSKWPFIVHTPDMNVRVLGTEFDVRAYADESFAEASLIKGSISVSFNNQNQHIYLKPMQKIIVNKETDKTGAPKITEKQPAAHIELKPVIQDNQNIYDETAWKESVLIFDNESLESLSKRLERWYGVSIQITDSTLAKEYFTGRADNMSLEKLLNILQMIKPFDYIINDKQVIIKESGQTIK